MKKKNQNDLQIKVKKSSQVCIRRLSLFLLGATRRYPS